MDSTRNILLTILLTGFSYAADAQTTCTAPSTQASTLDPITATVKANLESFTSDEKKQIDLALSKFQAIVQNPFVQLSFTNIGQDGKKETINWSASLEKQRMDILSGILSLLRSKPKAGLTELNRFAQVLETERNNSDSSPSGLDAMLKTYPQANNIQLVRQEGRVGEPLKEYLIGHGSDRDYHAFLGKIIIENETIMKADILGNLPAVDVKSNSDRESLGTFNMWSLGHDSKLPKSTVTDDVISLNQERSVYRDLRNEYESDPSKHKLYVLPALHVVEMIQPPSADRGKNHLKLEVVSAVPEMRDYVKSEIDAGNVPRPAKESFERGTLLDFEIAKLDLVINSGASNEKILAAKRIEENGKTFFVVDFDQSEAFKLYPYGGPVLKMTLKTYGGPVTTHSFPHKDGLWTDDPSEYFIGETKVFHDSEVDFQAMDIKDKAEIEKKKGFVQAQ